MAAASPRNMPRATNCSALLRSRLGQVAPHSFSVRRDSDDNTALRSRRVVPRAMLLKPPELVWYKPMSRAYHCCICSCTSRSGRGSTS